MQLLLLGTSGCHLCEQAEQIIDACLVKVELIDIAEQLQWQTQYAVHIPVLHAPEFNQSLYWPFDENKVQDFIAGLINYSNGVQT
jgi:hypothetical protein